MPLVVALLAAVLGAGGFRLSSPAFHPGGRIPVRFTCDGADVSPPLRWTAPPRGTRSLALVVTDVSTPSRYTHWLAWAIPPRARGLASGAHPPREGTNDFGRRGYGGPCPPAGPPHRYVFRLYALRAPLAARAGADAATVRRALRRQRALAAATLVGTYGR